MSEAAHWSPPPTDSTVVRGDLLAALSTRHESVKVLAAPSGYGKTVLAAQFASDSRFDRAVWVDCGRLAHGETVLLGSVAQAVRPRLR